MMRLFDLAAERQEEIEKAAFVAPLARGVWSAGKWILKNPLKSIGAALTGDQLVSDTKKMSDMANRASRGSFASPYSQNLR